ncbi:MAG: hypothetical protein K2K42_02480 [Eubacterium sp.]|nr:hypothetical protein [Eubacterium sp.]
MELYENFKPRCSIEEAYTIGYEQVPYDIAPVVKKCYYDAFSKCNCNDVLFRQNVALMNVYIFGFLSGARAVRERKHLQQAKHNQDSKI